MKNQYTRMYAMHAGGPGIKPWQYMVPCLLSRSDFSTKLGLLTPNTDK